MNKRKKKLKEGSRHLLSYLNKDCNHCAWDYGFLLGTIEAKLHDMENFFSKEENCHLMNWEKVYHQIKWVRSIMNIAINEKFDIAEKPYINKKNLEKDTLERLNSIENNEKLQQSQFFNSYIYDIYREKALRLAFKLLGRHCITWWD